MNELLLTPRRYGKTTLISEWVKEGRINNEVDSGDRIMVVISGIEKSRVMAVHGLGYHEVETMSTIIDGYHPPTLRKKTLYVDNLDLMMTALFGTEVEGASFSVNGEGCVYEIQE